MKMMQLYRVDYEWDEYLGAGEWATHQRYRYALNFKGLGKALADLYLREDNNRIVQTIQLNWSLRGLWICWRGVDSQFKNLTKS